ncbi:MAG: OmpA family protein [Ekhidna sp.]
MKRIIILSFTILSFTAFSQVTVDLIVKQGDEFFDNAQYQRAITFYKAALEENDNYAKAKYQLGESYRLTQDYESAEFYYQEIASRGGDTRFPLAGFYYGLMQKLKGDYNASLKTFRRFDDFLVENSLHEGDKYRYFYKQSKIEIDGCQLAINQVNLVHEDHKFKLLDAPLNSEYNDYAAFTLENDSILCLTSAREGGKGSLVDNQFGEGLADLFRFTKNENGWEEVEESDRFENMINTKWGDGSGSFNRDRTKFYYTNCHEDIGEVCHIYSSSLVDGRWSEPQPLNSNINEYGFNSKHPQLSPGGDTLFYVSDREGGIGGLDIWMSLNAGGNNWGPATHLGDQINTPFNEVSPFYDQAQKVLIFASDGHRGFGGFDIYIARGSRFDAAEIYNAGMPFNSNKDDIFFFLGNKKGYLSSNRDDGLGKFDIYGFAIKSKEEIINEVSNEETLAGRNSLFTDDYSFDNRNTEIINQIISRKLSSSIANMDLILTSEQLEVYNSLSLDDKERIEKIVNARVRKMTASMMRSIRSEDDFFYQQLDTDKRKKVNNVVTNYVEQDGMGLSVFLPQESSSFYGSVANKDREKIDVFISERVNDAKEIKHAPINYYAFAEPDREKIDGIALKYLAEKKNLGSLQLGVNERSFLNKTDESEKEKLNVAVREKLLVLSDEKNFQLKDEDRAFYEGLSIEDKESIKAIASAFLSADLNTFEDVLNAENLEVFKHKDSKGVKTLDKLLLKQISNLMKASMYMVETSFTAEELRSLEGASIEESLTELYRINSNLSEEDKMSLERFVKTTFQSYLISRKPAFTPSIPLASVAAPAPSKGNDPTAVLSGENVNQYESLDENKRWLVDRVIGLDYLSSAYANDPDLKTQDNDKFRSSSAKEKAYYEVLAKNMRHETLNESEKSILLEAFTYYNNLASSRKAVVNRLVLAKTFEEKNGKYKLTAKDGAARARLSSSELELINDLEKFRVNNERLLTENLAVEAKDVDKEPFEQISLKDDRLPEEKEATERVSDEPVASSEETATSVVDQNDKPQEKIDVVFLDEKVDVEVDMPTYNYSGFEEIAITGKLINTDTKAPLASHKIRLMRQDESQTVIEGTTNSLGYFSFRVPADKYLISLTRESNESAISVESFNMKGHVEEYEGLFEVDTRAYFQSDSYVLRPETKVMLDEIIAWTKGKDVKLEVESHTDNLGNPEYNINLSKKRGYAARDYLIQNGVSESSISVIWHGFEKPIAANDNPIGRQLNRRMDIWVTSSTKNDKLNLGHYFLVRPKASLAAIAKSFNISIDKLKRMNGLQSNTISAYEPIRVVSDQKLNPDLSLVIPADFNIKTDFRYTVQEGDDVINVAKKFNVPEELILELNGLNSMKLTPGTKIKIYPGE